MCPAEIQFRKSVAAEGLPPRFISATAWRNDILIPASLMGWA
jgi:hypothetical protein